MEGSEEYWKRKYFKLLNKNKKLKEELAKLNNSADKNNSGFSSARTGVSMFEAFCILGGSEDALSIISQFPSDYELDLGSIGDFAFPGGWRPYQMDLSRSGTAVYQLMYRSYERDENSFVFAIKSLTTSMVGNPLIPNNDKQLLYGICVIDNEFGNTLDPYTIPVSPKCYCLLSYIPWFELHFQVIYSVLSIKKAYRLTNNDNLLEIGGEQGKLLQEYYQMSILKSHNFCIQLETVDSLDLQIHDISMVDTEWACSLMFSVLSIDELWGVLCAAMVERNIVFISKNLGVASSCVLGLQALMRPFRWCYPCLLYTSDAADE